MLHAEDDGTSCMLASGTIQEIIEKGKDISTIFALYKYCSVVVLLFSCLSQEDCLCCTNIVLHGIILIYYSNNFADSMQCTGSSDTMHEIIGKIQNNISTVLALYNDYPEFE